MIIPTFRKHEITKDLKENLSPEQIKTWFKQNWNKNTGKPAGWENEFQNKDKWKNNKLRKWAQP